MIDRREFLKAGLAGGVAASLRGELFACADESDELPPLDHPRPNILWITAEDISPDLGCYGDRYAVTPNIDRFAAEGTRFDRAFAPAGVCAPARSSLITGMYPTSIGTHNMRCKGVPPAAVRCFTETLRARGYYCSNRAKTDYQFDAPLTAWDDCSRRAHWRGRAEGQPFFSVINITTTHESQIRSSARKLLDRLGAFGKNKKHDPDGAVVPPYYPNTALARGDWARYADLITLMDREVGAIVKELDSDGLAEETIVWFFGDHGRGLPRAKRWIYDSGIHVPLIVRVPETYRQLAYADDPAALAPGTAWGDLVSFVDFAPTTLSLAGGRVPGHMQGKAFLGGQKTAPRKYVFAARDRMDEAYDLIRAVRDKRFKYIRNFMPHITRGQDIEYMNQMPTMRTMRRLHAEGTLSGPALDYFRPEKPVEELYDTQADPHEIDNLAGRDEHEETLWRMRGALDEWMRNIVDVGLIPEPDLDEMIRPGAIWTKTEPICLKSFEYIRGTGMVLGLGCTTPGASIAYRIDRKESSGETDEGWDLYVGPVAVKGGEILRARAFRLGYRESDEYSFESGAERGNKLPPLASGETDWIKPHWKEAISTDRVDQLLKTAALGNEGAGALKKLFAALDDQESAVRYWAVLGVRRLCGKNLGDFRSLTEAKNKLLDRIDDRSPAVAMAAAEGLLTWGEETRALGVLIEALDSKSESVQLFAVAALGRIGERARPVLERLEKAARAGKGYAARAARPIVGKLGVGLSDK